jgi:hypothetical protein
MTKVMANSPAVLEGYLGFGGALGNGHLDAKTSERLDLITASKTTDSSSTSLFSIGCVE